MTEQEIEVLKEILDELKAIKEAIEQVSPNITAYC